MLLRFAPWMAVAGASEVISMSTFLSVRALHEERVPKKAIARRLGVDVRTVRKHIRRIVRGASEPVVVNDSETACT